MSQKVMILGLDGATWKLLGKWILDNRLPTFGKFVHSGSKAILASTIPSITSSALTSLFTGMNPGNHGVLSIINADGSPYTLTEIEQPKIWNIMDKHARRSCIVGVRGTYPPEKIDGVMISGTAPSDECIYVYPESLQSRLKNFKNSKVEKEISELQEKKRKTEHRKKLFDLLVKQTRQRYEIFKRLNQNEEYDFSLLWIEETDILQHCCWEYEDLLFQFYAEIDDILSDIMTNFSNRELFVVSDHGFEAKPQKFFYVNTWLQRQGKLRQKPWPPVHRFISFFQHFAYRYLEPALETKILSLVGRFYSSKGNLDVDGARCGIDKIENFPGIDKQHSQAYLSTLFGISMKAGDRVKDEIIEKLQKIRDEDGKEVIKGVWKREEVFTGRYLKDIPDIIFLASERYLPFPSLTKNLFGDIGRKVYWWRSGEHYLAREGILIACGQTLRRNYDLGSVNIEDITPTILHLIGCRIPRQIDGRVVKRIFRKGSDPAMREVLFENQIDETQSVERPRLSREDTEKIRERLKQLGYL